MMDKRTDSLEGLDGTDNRGMDGLEGLDGTDGGIAPVFGRATREREGGIGQLPGAVRIALRGSERFVEVADGTERYYGGDQAWFAFPGEREKTAVAQGGGCGTVAAANIAAYLARHHAGCEGLYPYPDYAMENFISHMEVMYGYVRPRHIAGRPLGVWPIGRLEDGVMRFAADKGVGLRAVRKGWPFTHQNIVKFIRAGLERDAPVAMVMGAFAPEDVQVARPGRVAAARGSFRMHWVTITELILDEARGLAQVKVSSWGGWAVIDLCQCLERELLYRGLIYFE